MKTNAKISRREFIRMAGVTAASAALAACAPKAVSTIAPGPTQAPAAGSTIAAPTVVGGKKYVSR